MDPEEDGLVFHTRNKFVKLASGVKPKELQTLFTPKANHLAMPFPVCASPSLGLLRSANGMGRWVRVHEICPLENDRPATTRSSCLRFG